MGTQAIGNHSFKNIVELFDPKIDYAFKQVFGQDKPECKKVLLHLLNAAFQRKNSVGIKSIEYVNPYLDKEYEGDKQSILDIKVKTEKDECIDIEMQICNHTYFIERCLWYWASLYERQLVESEDYTTLKRCIVVSIVDFEFSTLKEIKDYHGVFELLERNQHIKLTEHCEIHLIQLPKVHLEGDIKNTDNLTKWSIFLKDVNDEAKREVIEELRREVPEIDMATKILERVSQDERNRARYESRLRWVLDARTLSNELQRQKDELQRQKDELQRQKDELQRQNDELQRQTERAQQAEVKAQQAESDKQQAKAMLNAAITALYQSGMDYTQIAEKLNTTVEYVQAVTK